MKEGLMAFLPNFQNATFKPGAPINNQYFPLKPGTVLAYVGTDRSGEAVEADDVFVTYLTKNVLGVQTRVVRDTVYEEGVLVEETLDFYAQDTQGNVWYFGEIVINFEYDDEGNFIGTNSDGAWLAGVDGAKPGWIMPAHPTRGFSFFNEFAPGVALDEATIIALRKQFETDFGEFTTIKTRDTTRLEPGLVEYKFYAPGIGVVRVLEELDAQGVPSLVFDLTKIVRPGSSDQLPSGTEPAERSDFISDGDKQWVTIILEDSEFENSLGYYTFNPATGVIGEARIIFDGSEGDVGDTISIRIPDGQGIGFFLVPNSSEVGLELDQFEDGGLFLTNMLTGKPARLSDGMAPIVTDENGDPLPLQIFHVLGSDLLNPGTGLQAVEWDLPDEDDEEDELIILGFEEHRITEEDFDGDYNDLIIVVGDAPVDPGDFETITAASLQLDPALVDQLI
jgi:hypothetical protein